MNGMIIYALTTKTSDFDTDDVAGIHNWIQTEWGFIAMNLFNMVAAANIIMIRWEMNRWIRWYKRKTAFAQSRHSTMNAPESNPLAASENATSSLTKPLIQSGVSKSIG